MTGSPVVIPNILAFGYLFFECLNVNVFIFFANPFPLNFGETIKPE